MRIIDRRSLILVFSALLFLVTKVVAETSLISCEELRRIQLLRDSALMVVDVRSPVDFAAAHIQGASNIVEADISSANLPKEGRLVLYCYERRCPYSENGAQKLIAAGYANVSVLEGGIAEWIGKGYPTIRNSVASPKVARKKLSVEQVSKRRGQADLLVVDLRPLLEFSAGHIPGARNIPFEALEAAYASLPKDKDILIYDRRGDRSRRAAELLTSAGFRVHEVSGGLSAWVHKKYPLEVK